MVNLTKSVSRKSCEGGTGEKKPKVVVLGGGFAGLEVCKGLGKCDAETVLVDLKNHHLFQLLLYQTASAGPLVSS